MPESFVPPVDLELRLVRYFTVVAEELHFGRAADALHLAQPSLSRQIRRLERELGVRLLDRTPRGTRLTEAGEAFLPQARELLRSAARATASARSAAAHGPFTVGYTTHQIVTPAVRELRHRHPQADVRTLHVDWSEPRSALLDHRVDVVVTRFLFIAEGLDITVLYDEPRVLLVPLGHRLAGRDSVTLADFADEPLPRFTGADRIGANPPATPTWAPWWTHWRTSWNWSRAVRSCPWRRPGSAAACGRTSPPSRSRTRTPSRWSSPPGPVTGIRCSRRSAVRRRPIWSRPAPPGPNDRMR